MSKRAIAIAIAVSLMNSQISPAFSQQLREIEARVERLSELVDRMVSLQERVAAAQASSIETARLAQRYAGPEGAARAVTDMRSTRAEAERAKVLVEQLRPDIIGTQTHQLITQCILGANAAADRALASGGRLTLSAQEATEPRAALGCDDREVRQAMDALEAQRRQAVTTWHSCRQSLTGVRDIALPADPSGLNAEGRRETAARLQRLQQRLTAGDLPADAAACARNLQSAYDNITQAEDASAAVGSALALAAQVCLASGANPCVCGAMLLVALIMNMRGGGGSGGDGEGSGTSRRGRPGTGTIDAGDVPSAGRPAPPQSPSPQLGPNPAGPQTVLGGVPGGQFQCVTEGPGRVACSTVGNTDAGRAVIIDVTTGDRPEIELLRARMSAGPSDPRRVVFCGTSDSPQDLPFRSLAVFDPRNRQLASIALTFGQPVRRDERGRLTPTLSPEPMRTLAVADPTVEQMCLPSGN
jgi:hypothetical protein